MRLRLAIFLLPALSLRLFAQPYQIPLNTDWLYPLEKFAYSQGTEFHPQARAWDFNQLSRLCVDSNRYFVQKAIDDSSAKIQLKTQGEQHHIYLVPLVQLNAGMDFANSSTVYGSGGGLLLRADYRKKFAAEFRYQAGIEQLPLWLDSLQERSGVLPDVALSRRTNQLNQYQFFNGYVAYSPSRFFTFRTGVGRQFFGDGHRSLMLGDHAPHQPYAAAVAKFWRIQYTASTINAKDIRGVENNRALHQNKFIALHHLSWNIVPKFNISIFETIVYQSRWNNSPFGVEPNYLSPIVVYRPTEYAVGSTDNALLGMSMRWNVFSNWHLYTQAMLDEFFLKELRARSGWADNKYSLQGGIKGYDIFGVNGLFFQAEYNYIRPYMYYHRNTFQNFAHMNTPLAHPGGANLKELIVRTSLQKNQLRYMLALTYCNTGIDYLNGYNYGQNVYTSYFNRPFLYGNTTGQGLATSIINVDLRAQYAIPQWYSTLVEAGVHYRSMSHSIANQNALVISLGIRSALDNLYRNY
jgi:hypothetical protein